MFADLFLNTIYATITRFLALWPTGTLPEEATNAFQEILSYSEYVNNFFPMDTLWLLIKLVVAMHLIILGIKLTLWVYSLLKAGG